MWHHTKCHVCSRQQQCAPPECSRAGVRTQAKSTKSSSRLPLAPDPPQFDVPDRQATPEEVLGIAAGAQLTPQQQRAQQLQLPLTQPVRLPLGAPEPRALMAAIKAASSWQELEAAVYQKQGLLALQQQQPQQPSSEAAAAAPAAAALASVPQQGSPPPEQSELQRQQQQQQQQQQSAGQAAPAARKQRRKQPVPVLSVPTSSILAGGRSVTSGTLAGSSPAAAAAAAVGTSGASSPPSHLQQAGSPAQQQQQQQQQQPELLLNALHVTEAFHKLPALLAQQQAGRLQPSDRQRVAALITHLSAAAQHHASNLALDGRGLAVVLLGLSKLGHKDTALLEELQVAALLKVQELSSRQTAMVLMAFASLDISPTEDLMLALQQHISTTISLFEGQSLVSTIWALAKLQDMPARSRQHGSSSGDGGGGGGGGGTLVGNFRQQPGSTAPGQGADSEGSCRSLKQTLLWRCEPQMLHWSGRELAQAGWGLGKLGARPNVAWKQAFLAASGSQLAAMNLQDLSNVLAAVSGLKLLPDQQWVDDLCRSATTKMWTASPAAVHTLLLGMLRMKQGLNRAGKAAAAKQQQQQQQQQLSGTPQETSAPAQDSAGAAATASEPQGADIPGLSVSSISELRFLKAALLWVQRNPGALQRYQLAGVVTAVAELLPAETCTTQQQQQQQQREEQLPAPAVGEDGDRPEPPAAGALLSKGGAADPTTEQRTVKAPQPRASDGAAAGQQPKWGAVHRQVLLLLRELLPLWTPVAEQMAQSRGSRPGRFFKLKWAQLVSKCGGEPL